MASRQETSKPIDWHALQTSEVLSKLETTSAGLSQTQADERLATYGENLLKAAHRHGPLVRFLLQFHNVLIYLLLVAGVITLLLQYWVDAGVIFGVVVINAIIGAIQEGKAEKALDAISKMLSLEALVLRDGNRQTVEAQVLVPGDVVQIFAGDKVPADLRLIEARDLMIDEAMLTGESMPSEKDTDQVPVNAALADRGCMAYSGTLVTTGQATGVVVSTGDATELGRINRLVSTTAEITTPLILQMTRFGQVLAGIIVGFAVLTFVIGFLSGGYEKAELFLATVALTVAAIPEGLPAIMTIVLAIGVQRMASRNAIIRRLPAVDTLGAVSVICSDKTGTLTRNEMTVTVAITRDGTYQTTGVGYAPDGKLLADEKPVEPEQNCGLDLLIKVCVLCNDSDVVKNEDGWFAQGDPMESALLTLASKAGFAADYRSKVPRLDVIPFDSRTRIMATLHDGGPEGRRRVFVKGAPERVLELCDRESHAGQTRPIDLVFWTKQYEQLAETGNRVLAMAMKTVDPEHGQLTTGDVERGLIMLGVVGIIDPARPEAIAAVARCQEAGIRVVMITGDHSLTAKAIGKELGIGDGTAALTGKDLDKLDESTLKEQVKKVDVYARVSPEHKLRLVEAIQANGHVVAMTGDGVNDAPALKRADVGIAMGIKGTAAAKEAAQMVLADDNFASIAVAVEEGRTVYDNLRKAVYFILPTNGGQSMTVFFAILFVQPLPLTPVQLLWVNMVTAVTLALALAFEPPEKNVMKRLPRSMSAGLLSRVFVWRIVLVSSLMCGATFIVFETMLKLGHSLEVARTAALNIMVLCEVFYLFNTRYLHSPVLNFKGLFGSRPVLISISILLCLQMLMTYTPFMNKLFGTSPIGMMPWLYMTAGASCVLFLVELDKLRERVWGTKQKAA